MSEACECPARKALEDIMECFDLGVLAMMPNPKRATLSEGVMGRFAAAVAALSVPCPCEGLCDSNWTLRRRLHKVEGHNQFFERCESAWCHPAADVSLASEGYGEAWKTPAEYEAERDRLRSDLAEALEALRCASLLGWPPVSGEWRTVTERAAAVLAKHGEVRRED